MAFNQFMFSPSFVMIAFLVGSFIYQVSVGLPVVKWSSLNDRVDGDMSMSDVERQSTLGDGSEWEDLNDDIEKRSAMEELMDGENVTAGGLIYMINKDLPKELSDMIVDMDIVRSENIEAAMQAGVTYDGDDTLDISRRRRGAVNRENPAQRRRIWPDARVPYVFDPFVSRTAKTNVRKAMALWMAHTCIRFVPKTREDTDYVQFSELPGCWSYVGKQGRGPQRLSLGVSSQTYCRSVGVLLHELGHTIGFYHEQCRPDRDHYIIVHWENIIVNTRKYFWKQSKEDVNSFSIPYDYHSIMHYPEIAFSDNGEPTLEAKQPGVSFMGQRNRLSPLDIKQANLLYNCQVARNDTVIPINDTTWEIPSEAFLIRNHLTHTCLTASKTPSSTSHDQTTPIHHGHHYHVTLTTCNSSLYEHYWQWNGNHSIVHLGTLLCLTGRVVSNADGSETSHLFLSVCSDKETSDQTWSCAGNFIEQPDTGKCLSVHDTPNPTSSTEEGGDYGKNESDLQSTVKRRIKRETLEDIAEELGRFLQDLEGYDDEQTELIGNGTKDYDDNIEMSRSDFSWNETMVSMSFCDNKDGLQMWSAVQPNKIKQSLYNTELTLNETEHIEIDEEYNDSICSFPFTSSHRLTQCYAQSMETNLHSPSTWTTCRHIGYYVAGFYHIQSTTNINEGHMTGMRCCGTSVVFTGESESPPSTHREVCRDVDWWNYRDTLVSKGWFLCPRGMFLKGFDLSTNKNGNHVINKAKCCKPAVSPVVYEHCYTEHAQNILDTRIHGCRLEGYQVTGIYKKRSGKGDGTYIEEVTCCMHV